MALWDRFKDSAATMQTQLTAKKNDLKSGAFRDASMAMCALVAAADGSIDASERQRVASLITANDVLQNFPAADLQRRFDENVGKPQADFAFGKVGVLQEIAKAFGLSRRRDSPHHVEGREASRGSGVGKTGLWARRPVAAQRPWLRAEGDQELGTAGDLSKPSS